MLFIHFIMKHIKVGIVGKERKKKKNRKKQISFISFILLFFFFLSFSFSNTQTHRILSSLTGAVYTLGFIMMTPQLFINYKLKSVAHLPWKTFMYKALNTFIDDLFAFIIRMPILHRLSVFRDGKRKKRNELNKKEFFFF